MCKIKKINDDLTPYKTECGKLCTDLPVFNGNCICCKDVAEIDESISQQDQIEYYKNLAEDMRNKYWDLIDRVRTHIKDVESQGKMSVAITLEKVTGLRNFLTGIDNVLEDQHGKKYYLETGGYYQVGDLRIKEFKKTI
jgi:conjugal transfer/entry exclusion protein